LNDRPLGNTPEHRILIMAPVGRDARLVCDVLKDAGLAGEAFEDISSLCQALNEGAGSVLLAEEALSLEALTVLSEALARQPFWSDLPIVILSAPADSRSSARIQQMLDVLGGVTLVERPARVATVVTAIKAALRARDRQYAARKTLLELEEQKEKLRRADKRKDEFLAMLAHELRNPLAAISTALALLEASDGDPAKDARHRETARRQMRNLVRLVDDLLDVSRITRGLVDLRTEQVDLVSILHSAIGAARPAIESRQHQLELAISSGAFQLKADSTRLEQVVANLLSNAAKYTPPKGTISVQLTREIIQGAPHAVLRVKDTGRGIPMHLLERVFEMFVQVDQTLDRSMGGLGLGLTLVRRLVQMHGGRVEAISSGPGTGSEFVVRLPLADGLGAGEKQEGGPLATNVLPRRRVLLIEDSEDVRETLKEFLEGLGHEVVVAVDGLEGVAKLLELVPDVALVDVGLPGIDGFEVARRVRAHAECERSYLIALTGYGGPETRAKAERAGFDLYLTKPISIAKLPEMIARSRTYVS
jgi:signal transduction histidine kinase